MAPAIRQLHSTLHFDARAAAKRVGLILLATDHTTEADFARLVASERVGLFATRIAYANPTTPENLSAAEPRLEHAAALLLPDEALDVVCFSCTSASVIVGDAAIAAAINRGKPGVPVVTPSLAARDALQALGALRISILTPYTAATSEPMAGYFEGHGFDVRRFICLGLEDDRQMARLSRASLVEAAMAAVAPDADALFISCTALRSVDVVEAIEARIGRPVVASNQATAWACLGHCGVPAPPGYGRLMALSYRPGP